MKKKIPEDKEENEHVPYFMLSSGTRLSKKQFIRYFEKKVLYTISKYDLIKPYQKIAVACSGGKDSMALLSLLNNICKERRKDCIAIMIDEGMTKNYRKNMIPTVQKFCKKYGIKLIILSFKKEFGFSLEEITKKIQGLKITNCYVCSILKRWLMNKKALELGIEAIATAHSLDDEAESIMLNLLKGNPELLGKLGPVSGITTKKDNGFSQRIKPFYLCSTKEIVAYCKAMNIPIPADKVATCPMRGETFRVELRNWLANMEENGHKEIKNALVSSFLKMMPMLKEQYRGKTFSKCKKCGFPASKEICKTCELLDKLKK